MPGAGPGEWAVVRYSGVLIIQSVVDAVLFGIATSTHNEGQAFRNLGESVRACFGYQSVVSPGNTYANDLLTPQSA